MYFFIVNNKKARDLLCLLISFKGKNFVVIVVYCVY